MDPVTWKKLERIFNEAMQLPTGSRDAFACRQAAGCPEILAQLRRLLRIAGDPGEKCLLDEPPVKKQMRRLAFEVLKRQELAPVADQL